MRLNDIKLIIWDLDETFWKGIISDGDILIPQEHKQLVIDATDCGVMCSICSKNDELEVHNELKKNGIDDLFVFSSINWTPKGERVKQIVTEMNLRMANVMFIDDNPSNRFEVLEKCDGITVEDIDIIPQLCSHYSKSEKKDKEHIRLNQYKVLETKKEFKAKYGSNEDFLVNSNIKVDINDDCINHLDRIVDLINRSNQLNFTKIRSPKDEIVDLINDKNIQTAYVKVSDKFGDYGIVGFYALKNNRLLHFVFSCRTLGMGVEQYVYRKLNKPQLNIVGEVSSNVYNPDPYWINIDKDNDESSKININEKIVIKGLCDMQQMFAYIAENKNIVTEFEYVNDNGVSIEQRNHTHHIVQSLTMSEKDKNRLTNSLPFGDKDMFTTSIFCKDVKYIVLSLFDDPNLGLYKEKSTGIVVGFGEYTNDLTDRRIWDKLIRKELFVANCSFKERDLEYIAKEFEYIGRITVKEIINNLNIIYSNINVNATLILVLPSEREYKKNVQPAYADRHIFHKNLNNAVKEWMINKDRIRILDVNEIATKDDDYTNNINHFSREIYYKMSSKLVSIIKECGGFDIKQNGEFVANITHLKRKIKKLFAIVKSYTKNNN